MPIYEVPRDLPLHGLSFEAMVLGDPDYAMGAFDAYMDTSRDYSTWFAESFVGPIIGECWEAPYALRWPLGLSGECVLRLSRPE